MTNLDALRESFLDKNPRFAEFNPDTFTRLMNDDGVKAFIYHLKDTGVLIFTDQEMIDELPY